MPRFTPALVAALALGPSLAQADVKLPGLFSDHMVLQAGRPVPVWGTANPDEPVTIAFAGQTKTARAGKDGKWSVQLAPLTAADPAELVIKARNTITISDVLVGEVWLCSGQSNMALPVSKAKDSNVEAPAAKYPAIRQYLDNSSASPTPRSVALGKWVVCSPETVGDFSATAYYFGREIHQKNHVAVGLLNSSVGGTPIEGWTSADAQAKVPELAPILAPWTKAQSQYNAAQAKADFEQATAAWKAAVEKAKAENKKPPQPPSHPIEPNLSGLHPGNLFNGKINPLIPYAIRGAIWYQGEANSYNETAPLYGRQLSTMITDWRTRWGYDFPFISVQLPDFEKAQAAPVEPSGRAAVREGVLQSLALPNTGLAVTLGTGEAASNHPKNKQEVGRRLALWALANVYNQKDLTCSGPLYASSKIEGDKIILSFTHTEGGLVAKGGPLKGFAIAGKDQKWLWANAQIDGNTVIVSHPDLKEPVAARYAWASNPVTSNLTNASGLPASPFRTDKFPLEVQAKRPSDP